MSKKSKAPAKQVSAEDALRLENAMMRLDIIKAKFRQDIEKAAQEADELRDAVWTRYGLKPEDSVDLRT
jgi:hypothetical protein